jgi:hypothetical protein
MLDMETIVSDAWLELSDTVQRYVLAIPHLKDPHPRLYVVRSSDKTIASVFRAELHLDVIVSSQPLIVSLYGSVDGIAQHLGLESLLGNFKLLMEG